MGSNIGSEISNPDTFS